MLVERRSIEVSEAVLVGWEMGRHPVQNDADAGLVCDVDKVLEPRRVAKARGWRVQTGRLIAPAGIERMLADGQQLDMGETQVLGVGHELLGELLVAHEAAVGALAP